MLWHAATKCDAHCMARRETLDENMSRSLVLVFCLKARMKSVLSDVSTEGGLLLKAYA